MYQAYRIKKRKRKKGLIITLSVLFTLIAAFLLHYFLYVAPLFKKVSEEQTRAFITATVEKASAEIVTNTYSYRDFVEIVKDGDNNIALLQANSVLVHTLARSVSAKANEYISAAGNLTIEIPLGNMTGITLFAGRGPLYSVKAIPVGVISVQILSEFFGAGINQTLHRISFHIRANVDVILPGVDSQVSVDVPVPVAESVIVGKVPQFYLNSGMFDKTLNLVP